MKLAAFPLESAFLPALAQAWLAAPGDPASGLIILPNRRAARALATAFLPANGGKALLLPRIIAPGAIDEAALALSGGLSLPTAIPVLARQSILARLILAMNGANGAPQKLAQAWALAADLAALLDQADEAEIDLAATLPQVVAAELATHWQQTLEFLDIVTHRWPEVLGDMGMLNPAARQAALIDAQAEAWRANPPGAKIWLVTGGADPALTRLAAVVATLPDGAVILPGHDASLDDAAWDALGETHPAAGIARLLTALGARREEVATWPAPTHRVPPGRAKLMSQALLPAACLHEWQSGPGFELAGLHRLSAGEEQSEAVAVAMVLRDALEAPGATAALITPDRGLALRVAAALRRFGITADDSAGEALNATPPAVFLRLLSRAAIAEYAPLPLLALLKHPLSAAGEAPQACRAHARALEVVLRGPRPLPGFDGIKYRLFERGMPAVREFLDRLERILKPVTGLTLAINPADALQLLIGAGEALAATADSPGAAQLWSGEVGTALSDLLAEAMAALQDQPPITPAELPDVLDALLAGRVIRRPRSKDGHPRIAIWGVQEAMLQSVDTAVLGGLVEGVWPAVPEPGPWLSRPMRKAAGLDPPERAIGAAAQQFFALACCCRNVVLSAPSRRDRAPAVPARWLTRLEAMLAATGQALPPHDAAIWAEQLDRPLRRGARARPTPRPPAMLRPKVFSLTDIATLIADPYAIYARHVLHLRELDPLDEESDQKLFGNIVHAGLAAFFSTGPDFSAPDAPDALAHCLQIAMRHYQPRAALENWWAARLQRIAEWIIEAERERRLSDPPVAMAVEKSGEFFIPGGFTLRGRADRIEKRADGTVFIIDYKTGKPPEDKEIGSGAAPQLPLEAVMAQAGAFGPEFQGQVAELAFWKLSGRHGNGEDKSIFPKDPEKLREVIDNAAARLPPLLRKFASENTPFLARPHPGRKTYDRYQGVSRSGEWGGEDDGE